MFFKQQIKTIAAVFTLALTATAASAANYSFSGTFDHDNDVQLFSFTVSAPTSVSLRSWSYAGGTNAAGAVIASGGFDPILGLFDSAGALVREQDDAGCSLVAADSVTGYCWDTFYTTTLAAGTYTASIQQYDNFSSSYNLADGFYYDGAAHQNFRGGFIDETDTVRDSHWAFDILNVDSAVQVVNAVAEPESLALVGFGLFGMVALRRRQQK